MGLELVKFYKEANSEGVELRLNHSAVKYRLFLDYVVGIDKDSIVLKYPLEQSQVKFYQSRFKSLEALLQFTSLQSKSEKKYHISNILYMMIEFENNYRELLNEEAAKINLDDRIQFLRLFRKLNQSEKQSCKVTISLKHNSFTFGNKSTLNEAVLNKLIGNIENEIRFLFPKDWRQRISSKPLANKKKSESSLSNKVVGKIARRIAEYLSLETETMRNDDYVIGSNALSTPQGNFIYELLTLFNFYKPRNVKAKDNGSKINHSEAIQKLIRRS